MANLIKLVTIYFLIFTIVSCQNQSKKENTSVDQSQTSQDSLSLNSGQFCFLHAENKDTTFISLTIDGIKVSGTMTWQPYEKDGAVGELSGIKTMTGELELVYAYVIEGSSQTETKVMKIEGDRLFVKVGELLDPANDGNLTYKDVSKATYSEILELVACE